MKTNIFLFALLLVCKMLIAQTEIISLYPEGIPCKSDLVTKIIRDNSGRVFKSVGIPELWHYPAKNTNNNPALLIIPGGSYYGLWFDKEGVDLAKWANSLGISAFVLKHRLPYWENDDCKDKVALIDAQRAMRIIRMNASNWKINSDNIGVVGFSAGGHLASTLSTHFDYGLEKSKLEVDKFSCRPDFSVLVYPVVTMTTPSVHMGSRENLLGKIPEHEKVLYYSNELRVTSDTPPALLIHASDDTVVIPENSIKYYKALLKHRIPAELHIWQDGGHGFGISEAKGAIKNWVDVLQQWMYHRKIIN